MKTFALSLMQTASRRGRSSPNGIWATIATALITILGTEIQKFLDTRTYPEIDNSRFQALQGYWGGYGIQPITDSSSEERLRETGIEVREEPPDKIKKKIKDFCNRAAIEKIHKVIRAS